jgi:DNA-binding MarR family transcriptional regulator
VSKEQDIKPVAEPPPALDSEDIKLQINLRLRLDEVAEIEAKVLRAGAERPPSQTELWQLACRIYDARRARDKLMDGELFGEPAWDMLLALYCLPARGYLMTVKGLAYSAAVPPTTGLRWQKVLQVEGFIERGPQGADLRKQILRLTPKGRALMDKYLTRLFYCDTPMPPHPAGS